MFVINTETIIQLETDTHAVVGTQVVATIHVFNTVTHEVRLNGFQRILVDWECIARKVFQTPRITGKVVVNRHFLVVIKF